MKSLLVDVLRQAKDSSREQTLSDSGSYDTTQGEMEETANDPVAQEEHADELKLIETSASLDASFELSSNEDILFGHNGDTSRAGPSSPSTSRQSTADNAPVLARIAPFVAVGAALLSAVVWIGYHQLVLNVNDSELASQQAQFRGNQTRDNPDFSSDPALQRFPFIAVDAEANAAGNSE